ncbi:hypothetical protein FS749_009469 [Ceratobasidium sp. UAMH 11750]|nr:hypothetical protein FS749_009469 [Ceratobasidium sp. UAMH 11750]
MYALHNRLAEGHVKLLIGRLKRLCTGTVGESPEEDADASTTPESWPKHLALATAQLNDRVLPSLGYSPRELLTGILQAERKAQRAKAVTAPAASDIDTNLGLTYALRQDAFAMALEHANRRKRAYDKKARATNFRVGDLVQRYDARLDETHSSLRKLAPRWSGALRVAGRTTNSYQLEDLQGNTYSAATHTRLLCPFVPRQGTPLAAYRDGLARARLADPAASEPEMPIAKDLLPATPRPESRIPLEREGPTQPAKVL